jgi:hypothetical protein
MCRRRLQTARWSPPILRVRVGLTCHRMRASGTRQLRHQQPDASKVTTPPYKRTAVEEKPMMGTTMSQGKGTMTKSLQRRAAVSRTLLTLDRCPRRSNCLRSLVRRRSGTSARCGACRCARARASSASCVPRCAPAAPRVTCGQRCWTGIMEGIL